MKELTGQRFGRLTVIEKTKPYISKSGKKAMWICKCDCGKTIVAIGGNLKSGKTKSCGCLKDEKAAERISRLNLSHGKTNTRIYHIWRGLKERCLNSNSPDFIHYGGRGITVCDEWRNDFQTFYDWAMSNGYEEHLTIDRIDVNGNYEPSNCRWVTIQEQQNNRRNNNLYEFDNQKHTLSEWANITGVKYSTLNARIKIHKWDIEKALITPVKQYKKGEKKDGNVN